MTEQDSARRDAPTTQAPWTRATYVGIGIALYLVGLFAYVFTERNRVGQWIALVAGVAGTVYVLIAVVAHGVVVGMRERDDRR